MNTATFGSISSGTMCTDDLLSAFSDALLDLSGDDITVAHSALVDEAEAWIETEDGSKLPDHDENGGFIVDSLFDALSEFAPAYGYFGAHPGDGANYGFWLSECFEQDFDGLKVSDPSEVPADYAGEVLRVNDHGNITLYAKDEGSEDLREIWSLV